MLRVLTFLAVLAAAAAPASAALKIELSDGATEFSTITTAQEQSAEIVLTNDGTLNVLQSLFLGAVSELSLVGSGVDVSSGAIVGPELDIPAAFAGPIDLSAGTYLLSVNSGTLGTASFEVSQVPLPGALVLLGSGLAGLAYMRRRRAAA